MATLFIYGTLRDEAVQKQVLGKVHTQTLTKLCGYVRVKTVINASTYYAAKPAKAQHINGATIQVSYEDLQQIDQYETAAYTRTRVRLADGALAWTYVLAA